MGVPAECFVKAAGPADDGYINVRLAEVPGQSQFRGNVFWFRADSHREREILATALAALTSGMRVGCSFDRVELNTPSGSIAGTIQTIYLKQD